MGIFFNLLVAYGLLMRVGAFDLRVTGDALAAGLGMLAMALFAARTFGPLHGGNLPRSAERTAQ